MPMRMMHICPLWSSPLTCWLPLHCSLSVVRDLLRMTGNTRVLIRRGLSLLTPVRPSPTTARPRGAPTPRGCRSAGQPRRPHRAARRSAAARACARSADRRRRRDRPTPAAGRRRAATRRHDQSGPRSSARAENSSATSSPPAAPATGGGRAGWVSTTSCKLVHDGSTCPRAAVSHVRTSSTSISRGGRKPTRCAGRRRPIDKLCDSTSRPCRPQ